MFDRVLKYTSARRMKVARDINLYFLSGIKVLRDRKHVMHLEKF